LAFLLNYSAACAADAAEAKSMLSLETINQSTDHIRLLYDTTTKIIIAE